MNAITWMLRGLTLNSLVSAPLLPATRLFVRTREVNYILADSTRASHLAREAFGSLAVRRLSRRLSSVVCRVFNISVRYVVYRLS